MEALVSHFVNVDFKCVVRILKTFEFKSAKMKDLLKVFDKSN